MLVDGTEEMVDRREKGEVVSSEEGEWVIIDGF